MRAPLKRFKKTGKRLAISLGLYPMARRLYRRLSPSVRSALRQDQALYGSLLKSGDQVFDIGANLGHKTETFLKLGCHVVAVEPNPLCHDVLRRDYAHQPHCALVPKAVGHEPGQAILHAHDVSATASLRNDWPHLNKGAVSQTLEQHKVDVTTLDALIAAHGMPNFIKIDVEGFEPEVLMGLSHSVPLLSFEYHAHEADRLAECLNRLPDLAMGQANLIAMDAGAFHYKDWQSLEQIRTDILNGNAPARGDIFVRPAALD